MTDADRRVIRALRLAGLAYEVAIEVAHKMGLITPQSSEARNG